MDIGTLFGKLVIAVSVMIGIGISVAITRRRNAKLAPSIEAQLRRGGPQTLPALAQALGMGGFFSRGKVVLALNDLAAAGHVDIIPAPEGTAQLQKVHHILYRWRES